MCTLCKFSQLLWVSVVISSQSRKTPVLRFDPNLEECQHPHAFSFPQKFLCDIITDYENSFFFWCIHVVWGQVNPFVGTSIGLCDCLPLFVLAAPWLQRSSVSLPSWHSAFESPTFRHRYTHRHRHRHRQRTQTKTPILWVTFILRFALSCSLIFHSFSGCLGYTYRVFFCDWDPLRSSK